MTNDAISENGAPLASIDHAPGFATSESGHVHKLGHPKRGNVWVAMKPTAQIERLSTPGGVLIRRTGRFYFPVVWEDGVMRCVAWTPPPEEVYTPAPPPAEDDDDCPF